MKMIVNILVCVFAIVFAEPNDPTQIEKYHDRIKTYQLDVPGKDPITIIENKDDEMKWKDISVNEKGNEAEIKNLMTHIIHDLDGSKPRCYGPSCQDGYEDDGVRDPNEGIEDFEDYMLAAEKLKDYSDFSKDRLQAITALAAKLKKEKLKYHTMNNMQDVQSSQDESDDSDTDGNGKVYTTWNRLKVKQHKHPYDDKDGWVTLEPVAWSTSKISKWKPNVKKQKPNHWNEDDDRFPNDDERFTSGQGSGSHFNYPQKKPSLTRPTYINNKLHVPSDIESELPSRPTWASSLSSSSPTWTSQSSSSTWKKPQQVHHNHPLSWAPDEGRRPQKPNCDTDDNQFSSDEPVFYGMSDSVVTDPRPSNFPYEYEALHQTSMNKRPLKRPTQVVYAGSEYESDHDSSRPFQDSSRPSYSDNSRPSYSDGSRPSYSDSSRPSYSDSSRPSYSDSSRPSYSDSSRPSYSDSSRPPYGDGQWVLLSTTKGYRNKKRQRSLTPVAEDRNEVSTVTSHQAVALTVLPVDSAHTNMTTSHGGMLEVEKSFQTVEESKRDMDKKNDLDTAATQIRPAKNRVIRRKIVSNVSPDSSTLLAAVGAGMVPATMAMVVPMMLGRRRRRRDLRNRPVLHLDHIFRYR